MRALCDDIIPRLAVCIDTVICLFTIYNRAHTQHEHGIQRDRLTNVNNLQKMLTLCEVNFVFVCVLLSQVDCLRTALTFEPWYVVVVFVVGFGQSVNAGRRFEHFIDI